MAKITLNVCRSCVVQNKQTDPNFKDEQTIRRVYEEKLRSGWFGKIADLRVVDCLTNCENPNSVMIDRQDGEILFGNITKEEQIDQIIELVKKLQKSSTPLQVSQELKNNLSFIRPHRQWTTAIEPIPADRNPLPQND